MNFFEFYKDFYFIYFKFKFKYYLNTANILYISKY